jgi:hypothetical protein
MALGLDVDRNGDIRLNATSLPYPVRKDTLIDI